MAYTDINSEDRLVQTTFAEHLEKVLGWESVYAWNQETFRSDGTLGRTDTREAIYKKLSERRDAVDVTELLKALHRSVNEAIRAQTTEQAFEEPKLYDLSQIDLEKLWNEFAKKVKRKATALQDIRDLVEQKLAEMLARNPQRMDYYTISA